MNTTEIFNSSNPWIKYSKNNVHHMYFGLDSEKNSKHKNVPVSYKTTS